MWNDITDKFLGPIQDFAPKIPSVIIGLIIGILLIKLVLVLSERTLKIARVPKALSGIIMSMGTIILWIMLFSEIARELGLSSIALTISGSLIVLGLALANGAGSLTADILSGLFIAKDRDFEVGYKINTGKVEGIIQKIDIRKVRIIDSKGVLHVVSNSEIDKNGWSVIEKEPKSDKIEKKRIYLKSK